MNEPTPTNWFQEYSRVVAVSGGDTGTSAIPRATGDIAFYNGRLVVWSGSSWIEVGAAAMPPPVEDPRLQIKMLEDEDEGLSHWQRRVKRMMED